MQLVRRDFEQRFVGSAAGWVWTVIQPLVLLLSWTFVFKVCLNSTLPAGEVTDNYVLYLFAGMLPWLLFSETVQRSANSIVEHSNLITKTVFPSELIPVSVFLSALISHGIAIGLVVAAAAIFDNHVGLWTVLLPLCAALTGLLAVGLGWIVASLQVYLRDMTQFTQVALTIWFWLTPIFIWEDQVPEQMRWLVRLNPLSYLVKLYRVCLLSQGQGPAPADFAFLALFAAGAFVVGGLFFRHMKRGFADVL